MTIDLRPIKRAPVELGGVSIELGKVLEFGVDGALLAPAKPRYPKLMFSKKNRALMWFSGEKMSQGRATKKQYDEIAETPDGRKATQLFAKWSWAKGASKARRIDGPRITRWYRAEGPTDVIGYESPKSGKFVKYTHPFESAVKTYVGQGDGVEVWVVKGGRLNVTEDGIVG